MSTNPFAALASSMQGGWFRLEDVDMDATAYDKLFGWKFRCSTCQVTWNEQAGPLAGEAGCWVCGKTDDTEVWAFNGRPWTYALKPNAGALLGPPADARDHNNERGSQ